MQMKSRFRRFALRLGLPLVGVVALSAGTLVLSTGCLATLGRTPEPERLAKLAVQSRYADGRFENLEPPSPPWTGERPSLFEVFFGGERRRPSARLPLAAPEAALDGPPHEGARVTWFGHSTLLIEVDGARVLTDPIWSERASPSSLIGPVRFHSPLVPLAALPKLDAVVISHDHYDHLDRPLLPIHWATFNLAAHPWDEPIERVVRLAEERGVRLVTPMLGEPLVAGEGAGSAAWWRGVGAVEATRREDRARPLEAAR
jgi:hypothetical protein